MRKLEQKCGNLIDSSNKCVDGMVFLDKIVNDYNSNGKLLT